MSRKIVLVLPLVLVLALAVFVSTSAQGKVALTDAQMSSVYGGGRNCYTSYGTGCAGYYCVDDCSDANEWPCEDVPNLPNCDGYWKDTCKQNQRFCGGYKRTSSGRCQNYSTTCAGPYTKWVCGAVGGECEVESAGDDFDCNGRSDGPITKTWCRET